MSNESVCGRPYRLGITLEGHWSSVADHRHCERPPHSLLEPCGPLPTSSTARGTEARDVVDSKWLHQGKGGCVGCKAWTAVYRHSTDKAGERFLCRPCVFRAEEFPAPREPSSVPSGPAHVGVDPGGNERAVHRCTGCEWHIDTTNLSEERITALVHEHLRKDHNAIPEPPVTLPSPETREALRRLLADTRETTQAPRKPRWVVLCEDLMEQFRCDSDVCEDPPESCACGGDECWRCAAAQALKPPPWDRVRPASPALDAPLPAVPPSGTPGGRDVCPDCKHPWDKHTEPEPNDDGPGGCTFIPSGRPDGDYCPCKREKCHACDHEVHNGGCSACPCCVLPPVGSYAASRAPTQEAPPASTLVEQGTARERAHRFLGYGSDCMNHWVGDHAACNDLTRAFEAHDAALAAKDAVIAETERQWSLKVGRLAKLSEECEGLKVELASAEKAHAAHHDHENAEIKRLTDELARVTDAGLYREAVERAERAERERERHRENHVIAAHERDTAIRERDEARARFERLRNLWNEFMPEDDSPESLRKFAATIGETFDQALAGSETPRGTER